MKMIMIMKFTIVTILLVVFHFNSKCQNTDNIEYFTVQKWKAEEIKDKIDTLSLRLKKSFLIHINNPVTEEHRKLIEIYKNNRINHDNETNIYPEKIELKHLSVHIIDYGDSYGWEGQNQDSVYYVSYLTMILSIPLIENVYKSTFLSTISFIVTYQENTKTNIIEDEIYYTEKSIKRIELIEIE